MTNERTILIVDDCLEDREIYSRYLRKDLDRSYQIIEAELAEVGLSLCQKFQCDLILLDVNLPDMDGLEFLIELKRQNLNPPPAIVLTGSNDREIAVQAMKNGAQDYLVKHNLQPDILQLAVRSVIKNFHLETLLGRYHERQRLIATTALRIRQSLNLEKTLKTIVTEVRQLLQCERVLLYQFIANKKGKIVAQSADPNCSTLTLDFLIQQIQKDFEDKHKLERIKIEPDRDSSLLPDRLKNWQEKGTLTIPIVSHGKEENQIWGLLIAHQCSSERKWQEDEVNILKQLSVQLAIAIEQAELLAKTQAALAKEKELNQFKSQIIATVSHEYRSPLTSILAAASTLKQYWFELKENRRNKLLYLIEEKSRHMGKLVDEMLEVNKFESSRARFNPELFDPVDFFAKLIEQQQLIAKDRHQIIFNPTGHIKAFSGDRELLRQVFINLVTNSIKYSPDGGKIEVYLSQQGSELIFYVKDEGIGILKQERDNLFQSFSRGSNVGTIPGTGLGLAIVKACIDLHGGKIFIESELNQGTTVTVRLPLKQTTNLDRPTTSSDRQDLFYDLP